MADNLELKTKNSSKELKINLVKHISDRKNAKKSSLTKLPEDKSYNLFIEYDMTDITPRKATGLSYQGLINEINRTKKAYFLTDNLINIYVAFSNGDRK